MDRQLLPFSAIISTKQPRIVEGQICRTTFRSYKYEPQPLFSSQNSTSSLMATSYSQLFILLCCFFSSASSSSSSNTISSACRSTVYPSACIHSLSSFPNANNSSPLRLAYIGCQAALTNITQAQSFARHLFNTGHGTENVALQDCSEVLDDANYHLNNAISRLQSQDLSASISSQEKADLLIWLSTALSYQQACIDGFADLRGSVTNKMGLNQEAVSEIVTNALCLLANLNNDNSYRRRRRRLLSDDRLPVWVSSMDRKLLQTPTSSVNYNAIVAADGSGQYTTIMDAVNNIPSKYSGRYVIYIKEGTYKELVTISKSLRNITFLGDGIGKTIITGDRNVASGLYTTFRTATVAISGQGFIARDITFQNTAGPSGHQAVALRAGADHLVFDRCGFEGYQDTLYALSSRQFYRDCQIYGTVDFIFGNAAAVFQNCQLLARQPLKGQQNTYTAQGRTVQDDPTGYSFQNCTVTAAQDLQNSSYTVLSYLGRPWKEYSRTVFIQSYLDSLIQPAGWLAWNSSNPYEDTLYYGEYQNDGPGSGIAGRVTWKGVHPSMSYADASVFGADSFISGTTWLPDANVEVQETIPQ